MQSLVCVTPGQFEYQHMADPVLTKGDAIIRIRRIGICGTDLHAFEGTQPYFNYPRILGHELAGELIAFDPAEAPGFVQGESVTIMPYFSCGVCVACRMGKTNCCVRMQVSGVHIDGGFAEYLKVPVSALMHGLELSFEKLALVEPLAIGAHGVRRATLQKDEFVLVVGAGPIGLGLMEFARMKGTKVIAMDINEGRLTFCSDVLGIPFTINARQEKVMERLAEITNGDMPTAVFDATGNLTSINKGFEYLSHGGRYVLVGLQKENIQFNHAEFHKREATLMSSRNATKEDFNDVISSIQLGKTDPTKYITHQVPFEQVKEDFPSWLKPDTGVIKAMVNLH